MQMQWQGTNYKCFYMSLKSNGRPPVAHIDKLYKCNGKIPVTGASNFSQVTVCFWILEIPLCNSPHVVTNMPTTNF